MTTTYKSEQTQTDTQFYYGKQIHQTVGEILAADASHVLVLYGAKKMRSLFWYGQMLDALKCAHLSYVEYGGIGHHASLEEIEEGIAVCKQKKIDYILAVGGGSVIDTAKAIAVGVNCNRCLWTYCTTEKQPESALPIAVLLTTPGSGSESNDRLLLTNEDTLQNLTCRSEVLKPRHCFVNPDIFYTIQKEQLAQAVVQIFSRMIGEYLVLLDSREHAREAEKMEVKMKTLLRKTRALMVNRFDDNAWNELVLLGNFQSAADEQEDTCRRMAQELSAMYEVSYGSVLAVLLPAWMRYVSEKRPGLFRVFGENVMNTTEWYEALTEFLAELGMKRSLCELGIEDFCLKNAAQVCTGYGWGEEEPSGSVQVLYWQDLYKIFQSVYKQPEAEEKQSA